MVWTDGEVTGADLKVACGWWAVLVLAMLAMWS